MSSSNQRAVSRLELFMDKYLNWIFVSPAMIILVGLIVYPLLFNLKLSLHEVDILNVRLDNWKFSGVANYVAAITDPFIQKTFLRTLLFLVLSVTGQVVIGLIGAMALNVDFKMKKVLMPLVLLPMMITPVAVGLFWRMLLNSQWGIINYVLSVFGINPKFWLSDPSLAFFSVVLVQVWWGVSFVLLVILGGLTSLPQEPFEAAMIDGASRVQMFRMITIPLLRPVLNTVIMLRCIDAFREFDIIYTLTQGGPGDATRVFSLELYLTSFERGNFGIAAAQALLLAAITLVFAAGLIKSLESQS